MNIGDDGNFHRAPSLRAHKSRHVLHK
jgi:hypothetical protein